MAEESTRGVQPPGEAVLEVDGTCPTCDRETTFRADDPWLRDHLLCARCGSIPRERALMRVIETWFPNFRELDVHESSPLARGASAKLAAQCARYVASQWDASVPPGEIGPHGYRSEDLERLTFADASFDLVVTQDVLEHVLDPERAFAEIARTLRPGGAHVFTVPLLHGRHPSVPCARRAPDGTIEHLREPQYHGNPMDPNGSLVTMRWGYDICELVLRSAGLYTTIVLIDDLRFGIRAELNEVLVSFKRAA